jgi:hypothetical protein
VSERPAAAPTFIVRIEAGGAPVTHVGPFPEDQTARQYAERLHAASNQTIRAEVLALQRP